jgi:uncharacterized protein YutE (UPF0331/DUF86 family)
MGTWPSSPRARQADGPRVQSAADIASHVVADEGWRPALTLADAFERLRENGVLTAPTAAAMAKAAGLRNVVAHGYAGVDVDTVFAAASRGVGDLDAFASELAGWLHPPDVSVTRSAFTA